MDFAKFGEEVTGDNVHVVELTDPQTGQVASHDNIAMWVAVKGKESSEWRNQVERSENTKRNRGSDDDFDYDQSLIDSSRLLDSVTVAAQVFYDGEWIAFDANTPANDLSKHKSNLRQLYFDVESVRSQVTKAVAKDVLFLQDAGIPLLNSSLQIAGTIQEKKSGKKQAAAIRA